jgi:hypothetical protein
MKSLLKYAAFVLAATIYSLSAVAQTQTSHAKVPFAFRVDGQVLPAGEYIISSSANDPFVRLSQWKTKTSVMTMGQSDIYSRTHCNRILFDHVGGSYYLHELSNGTKEVSIHFAPTPEEKRAKRDAELAGIATKEPVLLALN